MYRKEVYIDLVQNLKSEPGVTVSVQRDNKTMSYIYIEASITAKRITKCY